MTATPRQQLVYTGAAATLDRSDAHQVACPYCDAKRGYRCVGKRKPKDGRPYFRRSPHIERFIAAMERRS